MQIISLSFQKLLLVLSVAGTGNNQRWLLGCLRTPRGGWPTNPPSGSRVPLQVSRVLSRSHRGMACLGLVSTWTLIQLMNTSLHQRKPHHPTSKEGPLIATPSPPWIQWMGVLTFGAPLVSFQREE